MILRGNSETIYYGGVNFTLDIVSDRNWTLNKSTKVKRTNMLNKNTNKTDNWEEKLPKIII